MSRMDVMKSLVRSAASSAGGGLERVWVGASLGKRLSALAQRRLLLPDSRLTAAVARVHDVTAATISSGSGELRVDACFRDGGTLLVHLFPMNPSFAPRGAKEWSMRTQPERAAYDPRCSDIVVALATEVARTLWGPFLRGRGAPGHNAFAHRDGSVLVVDLRTVPEVRSALRQPLLAAGIEAFGLRSVEVQDGGLQLIPNISGLHF
jgi:hypothetical protein